MLAALGILVGLVLALYLSTRWKVPMGLAFLLGALTMAMMAGIGPWASVREVGVILGSQATWVFGGLVSLVFLLSSLMRLAGSMEVLVQGASGLIRNRRLRVASLPALVGLMPMPGGAVVSAPLVESAGAGIEITPRDKNLINYWFRHIWEMCWPLYPPILLAATFTPEGLTRICLTLTPLAALLVLGGYWFILRRVPADGNEIRREPPRRRDLALALLPLLVVIAGMAAFARLWEGVVAPDVAGQAGLATALLGAILVTLLLHGFAILPRALREPALWGLLVLALGVKTFGSMVAETGAALSFANLVRDGGLPPLVAIVVLPLFVGLVSGATIAVVTVSFPIVVSLIQGGTEPQTGQLLPALCLAYAMGYIGYMLSPVHMCLVLSSRFFGETVTGAYPRLVAPLGLLLLGAAALYIALMALI